MSIIRVIGDVHRKTKDYLEVIKASTQSIQLGDMGFKDNYEILLKAFPSQSPPADYLVNRHRFLPGNHDDYDNLPYNLCLGDYGKVKFEGDIPTSSFFIRGANSIDKSSRVMGVSWWYNEELAYSQWKDCLRLLIHSKPDVIFSHDCPTEIMNMLSSHHTHFKPSVTNQALQIAFEAHQPELWMFGHHHVFSDLKHKNTRFICLPELAYADLDIQSLNISFPSNLKRIS